MLEKKNKNITTRFVKAVAVLAAMCVLAMPVSAYENSSRSGENTASSTEDGVDTDEKLGAPKEEEKVDPEELAKQVIAHTNAARKEAGLPELKLMDDLTKAAKIRAKELEAEYSHKRPDGAKWSTIFKELGMKSKARAENIAWGYRDATAVANAWLESKGHRKNIMNETYNYIAVAVHVTATGELAWEQLFCK